MPRRRSVCGGRPVAMGETVVTDAGPLFRAVNERIRELATDNPDASYDFVCECLDEGCFSMVMLTAGEFDSVIDVPDTYVICPGHEDRDVDEVIGRSDRYTLVSRSAAPSSDEE
jgi:hypothetical protein